MTPISIYIVEDELLISASLKSQLHHFNYEVCGSAIRGETCLAEIAELSAKGKEPEIVLMDIHLRGELDGIETAKRINEKFNCAIIFLTGQSSKEVYDRSFKIKPFGYLLKPIDMEQTKMTIEIASYQRNLEIENKQYRKNLEDLLERRSQENRDMMAMYQTIIGNSISGLTIWQDNRFVFANVAAAEIFGFTHEEFLASAVDDIFEMFHPDDQTILDSLKIAYLDGKKEPVRLIMKLITRSGQIRFLDTQIRVVEFKGWRACHQSFLDITNYRNIIE